MPDIKSRSKLRKMRGLAYSQVVEVQTQHKSLDSLHDIGTDSSCEACVTYNNLIYLLTDLSEQLGDKESTISHSRKPGYYTVTLNPEEILLIAAHTKRNLEKKYPNALITLVPCKEWGNIYFRSANGRMLNLEKHPAKKTGVIAKRGLFKNEMIWLKVYPIV